MKTPRKMAAFLLAGLLILSLCACSHDADTLHGRTILAYEQANYLDTTFHTVATLHYKLKDGCRDKLNMMFFVSTHNDGLNPDQIRVNDLYLLDLDTGIWYIDSAIDPNALYIGDSPNFETKENALKFFYNAFDNARGKDTIWNESIRPDYLPEEEVSRVNQMWMQNEQASMRKASSEKAVELPLSSQRQDEINRLLDQPAGIAKKTVSTIAEAIAYLNLRFPSLSSDDTAAVTGSDDAIRTLRSCVEILEDHQSPASRFDMATCVTYLLRDTYEIETLVAFMRDASGEELYPVAINMLQTVDGYWFFDPVTYMDVDLQSYGSMQLPEIRCGSLDEYVDKLRQDATLSSAIACIFKVSNGTRMDYEVLDTSDCIIETNASCAEMVYCNTTQ